MLDTNTVSHLVKQHPEVVRRVIDVPMASLCVSAITAGEMHFGLAKRPDSVRLRVAVTELVQRVAVLPWDSSAAEHYGSVRADLERAGRSLDALIAAHALSVGAVLVTSDRAFSHVVHLQIEDWTVA